MTEAKPPLRILLADDHQTVRQGLKLLIESQPDMTVVAEADDGRVTVERAQASRPDVVVLDISMPDMNGLVAARALKRLQPDVAIVTLTRHGDDAYLQELLRAGVSGYVLKQSAPVELLQAIRAAAAGGQYLDSRITARVTTTFLAREGKKPGHHAATLSERESSVLRLIALGYSNKEIAADLEISVKTVEVHKANAIRKLGLNGRIDVVRYAVLQGWLQSE
jgi:DNA-binding NarL/FixJ family response regulator